MPDASSSGSCLASRQVVFQRLQVVRPRKKMVTEKKKTYFFVDSLYFLISFLDKHLIILSLLLFNHPLALKLHLQKLSLTLINLVPLLSLPIIVIILLANPPLKEGFFLCPHDSFYTLSPLLHLKLAMPHFLFMKLLEQSIFLFNLLLFHQFLLISSQSIFKLFLMPIPGFE